MWSESSFCLLVGCSVRLESWRTIEEEWFSRWLVCSAVAPAAAAATEGLLHCLWWGGGGGGGGGSCFLGLFLFSCFQFDTWREQFFVFPRALLSVVYFTCVKFLVKWLGGRLDLLMKENYNKLKLLNETTLSLGMSYNNAASELCFVFDLECCSDTWMLLLYKNVSCLGHRWKYSCVAAFKKSCFMDFISAFVVFLQNII